ncbi:MAG: hypothetical protein DLM59_06905 [Pseudonocardiales bacterium]|nr:MAG: hypothetical protein DLM59_06905 [Pseudonocardiales bacterium]
MSSRDGHLGDLAAGLVDGALSSSTRDQALAHVAGCARCRSALDDQRRVKDRLQRFAEPDLPPGLAQRLRDIGTAAGAPDSRVVVPSGRPALRAAGVAAVLPPRRVIRTRRPATKPGPDTPPTRSGGRRTRRLAGGVTALAMGVAVVVVTLGPTRDRGPAVTPAVFRYTVEHTQTTGGFPGADPAAGAVMSVSADR